MTKARMTKALTGRELVAIAQKAGCPIRTKGGHTIIKLPSGIMCVMRAPGRPKQPQKLDGQISKFRQAGLI